MTAPRPSADALDGAERTRFLEIDDDTRAALAEFRPAIEKIMPELMQGFYGHMKEWPALAAMFDGTTAMERAAKAQTGHWGRLFSGRFDQDYMDSVRRIGLRHSRIGLEPRFYIGGYAFILTRLFEAATRLHASRLNPGAAQRRTARLMRALTQAVMLDMDLAISIYIEENKNSFDRRLSELGTSFDARVSGLLQEIARQAEETRSTAGEMGEAAGAASMRAEAAVVTAHQASANVQTVAAAAEELTNSIAEISRQLNQFTAVTTEAVATSQRTDGTVRSLAEGAQRIGEVVSLIDTIAGQTNLLALNATIEAARAGESGKGFAVVASEVKSLANETRKATETIGAQITAMQRATVDVVAAIEDIAASIGRINEVTTAVAAAVEEQRAATAEISRNVVDVAQGTREVSESIAALRGDAEKTGEDAARTTGAVAAQADRVKALQQEVAQFLQQVQAA